MSKYITVYGVYYFNQERTHGYSLMCNTESEAITTLKDMSYQGGYYGRIEEHTYEVED